MEDLYDTGHGIVPWIKCQSYYFPWLHVTQRMHGMVPCIVRNIHTRMHSKTIRFHTNENEGIRKYSFFIRMQTKEYVMKTFLCFFFTVLTFYLYFLTFKKFYLIINNEYSSIWYFKGVYYSRMIETPMVCMVHSTYYGTPVDWHQHGAWHGPMDWIPILILPLDWYDIGHGHGPMN